MESNFNRMESYVNLHDNNDEKTENEKFVIYPTDLYKKIWDGFIVVILFFIATTLPFRVAFVDVDTAKWQIVNQCINFCFLIDMILTFFTARKKSEKAKILEVNKKQIALIYLKSWFIFDLISIIPFEYFEEIKTNHTKTAKISKISSFTRFSRLPRLYKMATRSGKIIRIARDIKKIGF